MAPYDAIWVRTLSQVCLTVVEEAAVPGPGQLPEEQGLPVDIWRLLVALAQKAWYLWLLEACTASSGLSMDTWCPLLEALPAELT